MPQQHGKFDSALDEAIYGLSLDGGADEEVGSSSEAPGTWAGLMRDGDECALAIERDRTNYPNVTEADLKFLRKDGSAGAIIVEQSNGFVSVKYYRDKIDLNRDWEECEKMLAVDDEDEFEENGSSAKKHVSGSGPWAAYFETGSLADGDKAIWILRRPTQAAARTEALTQQKLRGGHVAVTKSGREVDSVGPDGASWLAGLEHRRNTTISDRRKAGVVEGMTKEELDSLTLEMPTFDWKQIGGDMNPGTYGGIIARADGDRIELIEIQPVREAVGDREAKDVGHPFWSKEATYDLDDLDPKKPDVQSAIEYVGLGEHLVEMTPEQRTLALAEACLQAGVGYDEGPGGWAKDVIGDRQVEWWGSNGKREGWEYIADEDEEFRREILQQYVVKVDDEPVAWFDEEEEAIEDAKGRSGDVVVEDSDMEVVWPTDEEEHEPNRRHTSNPSFTVGDRVQLAPHTDLWMRGARYGEVTKVGRSNVHVKLDRTGKVVALSPSSIGEVVSAARHEPNPHTLPKGYSKYGASMGRGSSSAPLTGEVQLTQIQLDDGGYDPGGAYWGSGEKLWQAIDEDGNEKFLRARDRNAAKAEFPGCTFTEGHIARGSEPELERSGVLQQLLEAEAESMEPSGRGHVPREVQNHLEVTHALREVVSQYEDALGIALEEVVKRWPPEDGISGAVLFEDDAPYLVLMTLQGAGVGIWDGRWDSHYSGKTTTREIGDFLKKKLGKFADDSGSGKITDELRSAVDAAMDEAGYTFDDETYVKKGEYEENSRRHRKNGQTRRHVFLNKELIATVYYDADMTDDDVRRSLISHDGYDPKIEVHQPPARRSALPSHYASRR